jgi:hypothetical protein
VTLVGAGEPRRFPARLAAWISAAKQSPVAGRTGAAGAELAAHACLSAARAGHRCFFMMLGSINRDMAGR